MGRTQGEVKENASFVSTLRDTAFLGAVALGGTYILAKSVGIIFSATVAVVSAAFTVASVVASIFIVEEALRVGFKLKKEGIDGLEGSFGPMDKYYAKGISWCLNTAKKLFGDAKNIVPSSVVEYAEKGVQAAHSGVQRMGRLAGLSSSVEERAPGTQQYPHYPN